MPHYRYQRIKDSLDRAKTKNDYFYGRSGNSISNPSFGVADYSSGLENDYFLILSGYDHDENVQVTNKNTGSLLTYPVWDKVNGQSRNGHLEERPISVKYGEEKERWEDKVYVPVSKGFGLFLTVLIYALILLAAVGAVYLVLFIPFRFLLQLAKGKAFTEENVGSLYLTGWALMAFGLLFFLINVTAHLIVSSQIPPELRFSYYAAFMKNSKAFIAGLSIGLLAKAFLQGLQLKEEQDLTV